MQNAHRNIGGFLPLELPKGRVPHGASVWEHWTEKGVQIIKAETARGVLCQLLRGLASRRAWFPAFICPEFPAAAKSLEVRYYPVDEHLTPQVNVLRDNLQAGDTVVGIDYFGSLAPLVFRELVREREDVHWIEDRAHALDPGLAWGDWVIYSPRKLLGVPDGGIGVCRHPGKTIHVSVGAKDRDRLMLRLAPLLARLEDTEEEDNDAWYAMFRDAEKLPEPSFGYAMSELSQVILKALPIEPIRQKRHQNALNLHNSVPPACRFVQTPPDRPLLGYPILLGSIRDAVAKALSTRGIFCAVHWRAVPTGVPPDTWAHTLAARVLTLPCDQRYGASEMNQVVEALREVLADFDYPSQ